MLIHFLFTVVGMIVILGVPYLILDKVRNPYLATLLLIIFMSGLLTLGYESTNFTEVASIKVIIQ